jgi:hypothetical protein
MERITYDQTGRAIEFARHVYRASRYAVHTSLAASSGSWPPLAAVSAQSLS